MVRMERIKFKVLAAFGQSRMTELKDNLKERNYPDNLIENGIKRAMEQSRTDLFRTTLKEKDDVISFVYFKL